MAGKILKNKPLVEAIFEIKWKLKEEKPGILLDPDYKILLGRFYERIIQTYPYHEPLPTSTIPDEIVGQAVQHRFRVAEKSWPLIQLGQGIMTVNDTVSYTWTDFYKRCIDAISKLVEAYPKPENLIYESILLRYIDAISLDYINNNVFDFLNDKLKTTVSLPKNLFEDIDVESKPLSLNWQASFHLRSLPGIATIRFATGKSKNEAVLLWETMVRSLDGDVPPIPSGFPEWIDKAHTITDDWFFKLIEGELERRFSGE